MQDGHYYTYGTISNVLENILTWGLSPRNIPWRLSIRFCNAEGREMQKAARLVLLILVVMSMYAAPQTERPAPPFANPAMLYSREGQLHVDLVAAPGAYTLGDHQFQGMLFNGQYMPPVWRLRAGDTLTVTLHNRLSQETNLHFHGLGVSPLKEWGQCIPSRSSPGDFQLRNQNPREARRSVLVSPSHARRRGPANHWRPVGRNYC